MTLFSCRKCGAQFYSHRAIQQHIYDMKHFPIVIYCPICEKKRKAYEDSFVTQYGRNIRPCAECLKQVESQKVAHPQPRLKTKLTNSPTIRKDRPTREIIVLL